MTMSTIKGYYYLHENGSMIYKNSPDAIIDIRDSDLCKSAWAWDGTPQTAWQICVEALSIGVDKKLISELADKWNINDNDAENYANYLGLRLSVDGDKKTASRQNFKNIQEDACGFGDTYLESMADLCRQLGFKGGKMWNTTFESLTSAEKKYPKGTTKEQWDQYEIDLKRHEERVEREKPMEVPIYFTHYRPTPSFPSHAETAMEAIRIYKIAYSEWEMMRSCDAPNKPGYYRANND